MKFLTPAQVTALMQDAVDAQGVDLGQIRAQLVLSPSERVDWLIAAVENLRAFRQKL
ncbi:MAG: hypothetical protein KGP01_02765 [Actinomycetales bacterium]|nr:hypothetical protein [Actinomycetales bacterium]